ncbi:MAG: hypothetical protein K0S36_1663 [Nitrosospira multiformis]|jgi:hypothetical protein|nr:hypothetical protein [Nitrosospira multiformis]
MAKDEMPSRCGQAWGKQARNGESSSVEAKLKLRQMRSGAVQPSEEYIEERICYAVFQKTGSRQPKTMRIFNPPAAIGGTE